MEVLVMKKFNKDKLKRDYSVSPLQWYQEHPTKEDMQYLYIELNMSRPDVMKYLNLAFHSLDVIIIKYDLHKHAGERSNKNYVIDVSRLSRDFSKYPLLKNDMTPYKEDLEYLYNDCQFSKPQLCEYFNTSHSALSRWLEKFNIKKDRSRMDRYKTSWNKKVRPTKEEMYKKYVEENKTQLELCSIYNISEETVTRWLSEYGIRKSVYKNGSSYESKINKMFGQIFKSTFEIIKPQQIDLYNEEMKFGIEFNGNYWHSTKYKDEKYHQEKSLKAKEKGVFLMHIYEYEWNDPVRQNIVLSIINSKMKKSKRIFGRKCEIKEITRQEAKDFLNINHLEGYEESDTHLGLTYKNELVEVMTFKKSNLNRFCSKLNNIVVGGVTKLFTYYIRKYNPDKIVSKSDIGKFKGDIYTVLQFKFSNMIDPDFKIIEHERIYDSGSMLWTWSK
jgi:transposase